MQDVLVENYRGGVTERLKIDYDTIKKINPNIIYAFRFRIWSVWTNNTQTLL